MINYQIKSPGMVLVETLKDKNISQRAAAAKLGISQAALNKMIKGELRFMTDMALKIESEIGGSAEAIMYAQTAYDLAAAKQKEQTANV